MHERIPMLVSSMVFLYIVAVSLAELISRQQLRALGMSIFGERLWKLLEHNLTIWASGLLISGISLMLLSDRWSAPYILGVILLVFGWLILTLAVRRAGFFGMSTNRAGKEAAVSVGVLLALVLLVFFLPSRNIVSLLPKSGGAPLLHGAKAPWSLRITSLVTNMPLVLWGTDDREAPHRHYCHIPALAEVYLTNNRTNSTMITNLHVEGAGVDGHWTTLRIIDTTLTKPIFMGLDLKSVREEEPIDRKYFDQEVVSRNINSGETINGWLFLFEKDNADIRWPIRITVTDIDGGPYRLESEDIGDTISMMPGGFEAMDETADLSNLKLRDCMLRSWE